MVTSNNGIAFIKQCEGCHLEAYKLKGEKYYTIGYGHTFDDKIKHDTKWTLEQAHKALVKDLEQPEFYVNQIALSKFPKLNQNQFDALVSYTYNRGVSNKRCTNGLRQLIKNSNTIKELSNNIVKYWGTATTYKNGLVNRRKKEQKLFNTPCKIKSIEEVAREVIAGKWGNGDTRKALLESNGYNYREIQNLVNKMLK